MFQQLINSIKQETAVNLCICLREQNTLQIRTFRTQCNQEVENLSLEINESVSY